VATVLTMKAPTRAVFTFSRRLFRGMGLPRHLSAEGFLAMGKFECGYRLSGELQRVKYYRLSEDS